VDTTCRLCGGSTRKVFEATLLSKHNVSYSLCPDCGLLQTERPYWLDESYSSAIAASDTGQMARASDQSRQVAAIILALFDPNGRFVDYGGGYGVFTRMMRDRGFDFYWTDPYADNIICRGFEYDGNGKVELVSSFETFEHFVEPKKDIDKILNISDTVVFSTELLPEKVPGPSEWWYYSLEHGQHIAFYSKRTMEHIATAHKLHYHACGHIHILTSRRLSDFKLRLLEKMPATIMDAWTSRQMRSRTASDMNLVIKGLKAGRMQG